MLSFSARQNALIAAALCWLGTTASADIPVAVDAAASRHPISPLIYGVAFGPKADLAALKSPLNRSGGNSETRYNWQLNATNHGFDWFFESLDDGSSTPGAKDDQ